MSLEKSYWKIDDTTMKYWPSLHKSVISALWEKVDSSRRNKGEICFYVASRR